MWLLVHCLSSSFLRALLVLYLFLYVPVIILQRQPYFFDCRVPLRALFSPSGDRSTAFSKAGSPQSAIYSFLSLKSSSSCYVFFLVFPSLLSFPLYRISEGSPYARCDQSSQPSFSLLYAGYSFPPCLFVVHILFFTRFIQLFLSIPLQHISNFPRTSDVPFEVSMFQRHTVYALSKHRFSCNFRALTLSSQTVFLTTLLTVY